MVDFVRRHWDELDITSLANQTAAVYQLEGHGDYTLEQVERHLRNMNERFPLEAIFLAIKEGRMVGWIGVERKTESIGELGRWYPYVSDIPNRKDIAKSLISAAMEYASPNGMTRLEISFGDISNENIEAYKERCDWFGKLGWTLVEDTNFMTMDALEEIPEVEIPDGFQLRPLLEIDDNRLYECHYAAFMNSEAREFYGLSEEERREHFNKLYDRFQSINPRASLVLMDEDKVACILLVVTREDEQHIVIVAVHPSYRRKGLAKTILTAAIREVRKQSVTVLSLGVDDVNESAVQLYTKYGFRVVSRLSFYSWNAK